MIQALLAAAIAMTPCDSAAYRQFDFWVGDWDAYDMDTHRVNARNHVTRILGSCVILEHYEQDDGLVGDSYNIYDKTRRVWHQSWFTNGGTLLQLDGTFENGRMTLTGADHSGGGNALIRGVWYVDGDGVRETATRSTDNGRTWTPLYDILFRPHRSP